MFRLELIIGPMFSGKSTELLRRVSRFKSINKNTLLINHTFDTRTENFVKTHDNKVSPAIKTNKLMKLIKNDSYKNADIIGIDEGQFFMDLKEFVLYNEQTNKTIIISGLDGDFKREPIGQILECIPLCDTVDKLNSLDMVDKDGSIGLFTKRMKQNSSKENEQILVGANEYYLSVNRKNYLQ